MIISSRCLCIPSPYPLRHKAQCISPVQTDRHTQLEKDKFFMREALEEAKRAYEMEEVPIGAVLVFNGEIVSRGFNKVESTVDPTAHAEMNCIREASTMRNNWRLLDCELYTTMEPCVMCAGAILQSRIPRVVCAVRNPKLGAAGSWIDLFAVRHPFNKSVDHGICQAESQSLLRSFFSEKRKQ